MVTVLVVVCTVVIIVVTLARKVKAAAHLSHGHPAPATLALCPFMSPFCPERNLDVISPTAFGAFFQGPCSAF